MKNHKSSFRRWALLLGLGISLISGATTGVSQAQPVDPPNADAPDVPKVGEIPNLGNVNPVETQRILQWLQKITPEQRRGIQQWLQNMNPDQQRQMAQQTQRWLQNMAPEQRLQMRQQIGNLFADLLPAQQKQVQDMIQTPDQKRENWVRQVLTVSGFTDAGLQNDVIAFMQAQDKARAPLRAAASVLGNSLVDQALTNEQLKTTWTGFRESAAKDQERYKTDLAVLDEKIKYSTQPRLEMLLGLLGVTGQETATLGGIGAIFPNSGFGSGLITDGAAN